MAAYGVNDMKMKEKMSDLMKCYNNHVEIEKYINKKTGDVSKVKTLRVVFYGGYGLGAIPHLDEIVYFSNKAELIKGLNRIIKMDILTRCIIKKVDKFVEAGYLITSFTLGH